MLKDKKNIKYFIYLGIFIMMIILSFVMHSSRVKKVDITVDKNEIIKLFDKITNNYDLTITETKNDKTKELEIFTDGNVKLYEGDYFEEGYLIYKDKLFKLDSENKKLKQEKSNLDLLNENYYNLDFLKNLINHCEFEYINPVKSNCSIKTKDIVDGYNLIFNTDYKYEDEFDITKFDLIYTSSEIGKVNIDYSKLNNIINNNYDSIKYGIKFRNINQNDFSELIDQFKSTLEK